MEKIADIEDEIDFRKNQIDGAKESIEEFLLKISGNKTRKENTEKELEGSQKLSRDLREKFIAQNEAHTKLEVKVNKIDSDIEQTVNNLWESYELTISDAE